MLEFNSDTPGGIVEGFYVNGKVCEFYGMADPNEGMQAQLTLAFREIIANYKELGYVTDHICFSALEWHEEDAGTTKFLLEISGLEAVFVPLKDLRIFKDRLFALVDNELNPVDVLYRLHPLGVMAGEHDEDGYPTGPHLLRLIAEGKVAVINPPGALIAQTKALQVLIWNLCEKKLFFDQEERNVIQKYMLPTYFENRFLGRCPYVVKPVFGREGGAVTLYGQDGRELERDRETYYWEQPMIYQPMVELPEVRTLTVKGEYQGRLLLSSFLVNGKASALVARLGGLITNDMSYFLPVCLAKNQ